MDRPRIFFTKLGIKSIMVPISELFDKDDNLVKTFLELAEVCNNFFDKNLSSIGDSPEWDAAMVAQGSGGCGKFPYTT